MQLNKTVLLVVVAIAAGACADTATSSSPSLRVPGSAPARSTSYNAATQSLGVSIGGYPHVSAPGTYTYWANVSGGTGPYTYDWFYSYCTNDTYECSDQMPLQNAGTDSVPVEIPDFVGKIHLIVHIYDSQGVPFAGSADYKVANLGNPDGTGGSGFKCDLGENYYPVADFPDSQNVTHHYRRDGCTGARVYDPTGR